MEKKEGSSAEFQFKTMADLDKERGHHATRKSVMGRCICGGDTVNIRFFGANNTMLYCCGDNCYSKINELYFKKGE